jgi:phage terminase large subunit GpA-like protein
MNYGLIGPSGWNAAAAPPPKLTVSEWADLHRRLPETSAAQGARWRTASTPYLRGVMDALNEPGVKRIALMKGAQVGGSEALHNMLGYLIHHASCPTLMVHPSKEVAQEWSKERLDDMIRSTPALAEIVSDGTHKTRGRADSTLTLKLFPGGFLALGGANTPNTFARRTVRVAMGDDVDRFPAVVGEEGDPAELLENRTRTFHDGVTIFVSTPTLVDGRIDTMFKRSDQRRFMVRCPTCGRQDWITWKDPTHFRVVFDDRDALSARIECPDDEHGGCGARMNEPMRRLMVAGGEWKATAVPKSPGSVGFHLPAMVSTLGAVTLPDLVERWLTGRERGTESLRVFINTYLAEGWENRGARMNSQSLVTRREDYGEGVEVPAEAVALTAGVDVQENRFELQVTAWGPAQQRWVVDVRTVPGDPKQPETRAALLEALQRKYSHAWGLELPIHAVCIDSGYATEEVYDFVLAHQYRKIFATKGIGGKSGEPIVMKPSEKRTGTNPRPVRLYPINVDDAKADVMAALALAAPGPGYIHFPLHLDTVDEEYFAQLCAEHAETRYNKAGVATHVVWVKDRERNEALDMTVLCLAALRLLNPNIKQMLETLKASIPPPPSAGGSTPPDVPPSPAPARPRVGRSGYLRR